MHLRHRNFKGKWRSEGRYRYIAERLFNDIGVDAFFFEYDSESAGDFAPLASVPADKTVVHGLVRRKLPQLESRDDLKQRIDAAAELVPLERLGLSRDRQPGHARRRGPQARADRRPRRRGVGLKRQGRRMEGSGATRAGSSAVGE